MTKLVGDPNGSRDIIGYCWPWTVRPGAQVHFMVSSRNEGVYRADLVRIVCADDLSRREMFKEEEIQAPFTGEHQARIQHTHIGSYVEINPTAVLDQLRSFSVQAMVHPTLLPGGVRVRSGGVIHSSDDPTWADQCLIARWNKSTQRGWALLIDAAGCPAFMIGDGSKNHRTVLKQSLVQDRWFLLAAGVDVESGSLHIAAKPIAGGPADPVAWPEKRHEESCPGSRSVPQEGPLRFAACADGPDERSRLTQALCFNGRLDKVRLTQGKVTLEEALTLAGTVIPRALQSRVIGFWDFAKNIDGIGITDLSPNALNGVAVNVPTRAVRGVEWDGSADDWRQRPDHYSAIHFHDDDLYDAQWQKDFSYTVPEDIRSGIYAARLRQGASEDYIPFFVAPPQREARASVALLLPTMTYTAYTNITGLTAYKRKRLTTDGLGAQTVIEEDPFPSVLQNATDAAFLLKHHRQLGKGIYANHTDGTLACCASQRHPNMTIKPKGITWTLVADTHITDWLEQKQIPYEVITDDLLHQEGVELLQRYAVVLTGNHPEYCTRRMLDAIDLYQRKGGRWMYLGGNGFFWVTSVHSQLPGVIEVRKDDYAGGWPHYELRHAFDGENGGLWGDNGRPPALLTGLTPDVKALAMEGGAPYRRLPDSYHPRAAFIFEGVSNESIGDCGLLGGGAAGQELDAIDKERGTPAHALHLARADVFPSYVSQLAEEYKPNTRGPLADLVFYETSNGGALFSVGSMSWVGALSNNRYDNDISRIMENVLRRFMDRTPFPIVDRESLTS